MRSAIWRTFRDRSQHAGARARCHRAPDIEEETANQVSGLEPETVQVSDLKQKAEQGAK